MHLSIIIPAYNEAKRISQTLLSIDGYLKNQRYDYEIIVVDGGSKDNTKDIVEKLKSKIKSLRLIGIKGLGKGHAVKEGMLNASGDFRIFLDADNSTSVDQIERMWSYFDRGYDVVIGSRDVNGAILDPPQGFFRRLVGNIFKFYRKLIVGLWDIYDTQCGFKGFSADAAQRIFLKSKINQFAFDPEILLLAKKFGYKIKEIPVRWKNDPNTTVNLKSMIGMAVDLIRIKFNFIFKRYE